MKVRDLSFFWKLYKVNRKKLMRKTVANGKRLRAALLGLVAAYPYVS